MYGPDVRRRVLELHSEGLPALRISRELGVSRATVREWVADPARALRPREPGTCFRCRDEMCPTPVVYAYLLGQYLGDGHVVTSGRVPRLRIACADSYPLIAAEVDRAMSCLSGNPSGCFRREGCSDHHNYWNHWPCLLPQHGPGRKHERPIVLAPWQQDIVDRHPWALIRGLIQSDGCRSVNTVTVRGVRYRYPRYFFANESRDILAIMGAALDRVGVAWRYNRPNSISVARRAAVTALDARVGPKR